MSVEGLPASSIGPAEAAGAATRAQRLQELLSTVDSAASPAGESSFAAALEAASAEGGAPPEAPEPAEPGEGVEGEASFEASTAGASEPSSTSTSTYASPYVSAESSAVGALDSAAAGAAEGGGYESPEAEALTGTYDSAAPAYLDTSSAAYTPEDGYSTSVAGAEAGSYASSLDGGVYGSTAASTQGTSGVAGASAYTSIIAEEASRNGVEPALLQGLIEQESGFDPTAESGAGAQGLTQLMPSTAASLGVSDPFDPQQAIAGGAKLLGELLRQFDGNTSDALAAYNAGAGAVEQYGGVPPYPETEAYVAKVLANAQSYRAAG